MQIPAVTGGPPEAAPEKPRDIAAAAKQFEGLLLGELLKSARSGDDGSWLGSGGDGASESAMGLGEEFLAQALAAAGGLGIARMVAGSLEPKS